MVHKTAENAADRPIWGPIGQALGNCYLAAIAHQGRGSPPWVAGTLPTCSYQTRTVTRNNG
jgi:hypothetical protein